MKDLTTDIINCLIKIHFAAERHHPLVMMIASYYTIWPTDGTKILSLLRFQFLHFYVTPA